MSNPFSPNAPRRAKNSPTAEGLGGPTVSGSAISGSGGGERRRARTAGSPGTGAAGVGAQRSPDRWSPLSSDDGHVPHRSDGKSRSTSSFNDNVADGNARHKKPVPGPRRRIHTQPVAQDSPPADLHGDANSLPPQTPDFGAQSAFDFWHHRSPDRPTTSAPHMVCANCKEPFDEDGHFCVHCGAGRPGEEDEESDAMSMDLTGLREDIPGSAEMRRRISISSQQSDGPRDAPSRSALDLLEEQRSRARTRTFDLTSARETGSVASTDDRPVGSAPSTHDTDESQPITSDRGGLVAMCMELMDAQKTIERQNAKIQEFEMSAAKADGNAQLSMEASADLEEVHVQLQAELQASDAELDMCRDDLRAMQAELQQRDMALSGKSQELAAARSDLQELVQAATQASDSHLADAEQRHMSAEAQLCKVQGQLREQARMSETFQSSHAEAEQTIQELYAEQSAHLLEFDASQQDVLQVQLELEATRKQARDIAMRSQTENDESVWALQTELATCEMQLDVFRKARDAAQNARIEAEQLLWASETESQTTGDQATKLEESLLAMRSELKEVQFQADKQCEHLKVQLKWRNEELDGYSNDLAAVRSELNSALAAKAAEEESCRDAHVLHEVEQRTIAFKEAECIKDVKRHYLSEMGRYHEDLQNSQERDRKANEEDREHLTRARTRFEAEQSAYDGRLRRQCEDLITAQGELVEERRQHDVELHRYVKELRAAEDVIVGCESMLEAERRTTSQTAAALRIAEGAEAAKIRVAVEARDIAVSRVEHALQEAKIQKEEAEVLREAFMKEQSREKIQAEALKKETAAAAELSVVSDRAATTAEHAEKVAEQRIRESMEMRSEMRQIEKQLSDGEQRAAIHAEFLEQRLADNDVQMDHLREQGIFSEAEVVRLRDEVSATQRICQETRGEVSTWRVASQEAQARTDEANEKVIAEVSKRAGQAREMKEAKDQAHNAMRERAAVECEIHEAMTALTSVKRELGEMREKEWRTGAAFAAVDKMQQELEDSELREEHVQEELAKVPIWKAELLGAQAQVQQALSEAAAYREEAAQGGPALAALPGLEIELAEMRNTMSETWCELRSARGAELQASDACEALLQAHEELGVVLQQRREALEAVDEARGEEARACEQRNAATEHQKVANEEVAASLLQVSAAAESAERQRVALKHAEAREQTEELHASQLLSKLAASQIEAAAAQELRVRLTEALAEQKTISDRLEETCKMEVHLKLVRDEDAARFSEFEEQEDQEHIVLARLQGQSQIESFCLKEEVQRLRNNAAEAWSAAHHLGQELEKRSPLQNAADASTGEASLQPPSVDALPPMTKLQAGWMEQQRPSHQPDTFLGASPDLMQLSPVDGLASPVLLRQTQRGNETISATTASFEFSPTTALSHMQLNLCRGNDGSGFLLPMAGPSAGVSSDHGVEMLPPLGTNYELSEAINKTSHSTPTETSRKSGTHQMPIQSDVARLSSSCCSSPIEGSVFGAEVSTVVAAAAAEAQQVLRDLADAKACLTAHGTASSLQPLLSEQGKEVSPGAWPAAASPAWEPASSRLADASWPLPWPPPPMLPSSSVTATSSATSTPAVLTQPYSLLRRETSSC